MNAHLVQAIFYSVCVKEVRSCELKRLYFTLFSAFESTFFTDKSKNEVYWNNHYSINIYVSYATSNWANLNHFFIQLLLTTT